MSGKILITGTSAEDRFLKPLIEAGYEISNPTHLLSEDELRQHLSDSVAYLLGGDEYASDAALSSASKLKVIAFLGVGYESFVDAAAAANRDIPVTNTPGTLVPSVAEFTVGQLLNARRQLTAYVNACRAGRAGIEQKQSDIAGHAVGIIGLGSIGTRIAEILRQGFGAEVGYSSRTRKPVEEDRLGIKYMQLEALVETSEALIIMTPGNESTRHLIGDAQLQRMNQGTILVNTSRPDIIDPDALRQGLEDGRIGTAVFDGFYEDEVGANLIADYDEARLLVTGHIASLTHDARDGMALKAVGSILNVLNTGTDENIVNRPTG